MSEDQGLEAAVREVLRAAPAPVGTLEIARDLPARLAGTPRRAIAAAVRAMAGSLAVLRGRYVYAPKAITGAVVLVPGPVRGGDGGLQLPLEALLLLWPSLGGAGLGPPRPAAVRLPDGSRERWPAPVREAAGRALVGAWFAPGVEQPPRRGHARDVLRLRCTDGEAGEYELAPAGPRAARAVAERDGRFLRDAARVLDAGQQYTPERAAILLLAAGAYHGAMPPTPLWRLAAGPPFVREGRQLYLRSDLTPAMWDLFAHRLEDGEWAWESSGGPVPLPEPIVAGCRYRLRARLGPGWWGEFDAASEHTLTDLHRALRRAVGFEGDHLYAFYLTGRTRDRLTQVGCLEAEMPPPPAEYLTLGHFDPQPGQVFAYVFDFGDQWTFRIEVLDRAPADAGGGAPGAGATPGTRNRPAALPRLLASRGARPRQYRDLDE